MLENLDAMHKTGIVHRDVKPQNMIISDKEGRIKMIDLGAAADLRVGTNYVPNEYLLDPRFAPPQQYVMSPLTPKCVFVFAPSTFIVNLSRGPSSGARLTSERRSLDISLRVAYIEHDITNPDPCLST